MDESYTGSFFPYGGYGQGWAKKRGNICSCISVYYRFPTKDFFQLMLSQNKSNRYGDKHYKILTDKKPDKTERIQMCCKISRKPDCCAVESHQPWNDVGVRKIFVGPVCNTNRQFLNRFGPGRTFYPLTCFLLKVKSESPKIGAIIPRGALISTRKKIVIKWLRYVSTRGRISGERVCALSKFFAAVN